MATSTIPSWLFSLCFIVISIFQEPPDLLIILPSLIFLPIQPSRWLPPLPPPRPCSSISPSSLVVTEIWLTCRRSSCIAYRTTILTEYTTSAASQTSSLASLILPKIEHNKPQKLTYTHNQNFIHYIADAPSDYPDGDPSAGGLTYLVVASSSFGRRIPFGYLVEIKKQFLSRYDPQNTDFANLPPYGAADFNTQLKKLMVSYGTTQAGKDDAITNVQQDIDNVKGIMTENIERVLERGERIDLLVDKTDRLGVGAHDFRMRSRGLKRQMWWKNIKLMVLLGVVVVFLIYLFVGFGCGLPGKLHALRV